MLYVQVLSVFLCMLAVVIFRVNESGEDMSSYMPCAMVVSMVSMKCGAIQWEGFMSHMLWVLMKMKLT